MSPCSSAMMPGQAASKALVGLPAMYYLLKLNYAPHHLPVKALCWLSICMHVSGQRPV
jgi:hypothetical protein